VPRGNRRAADEAFLSAYVGGATIENAASAAGISRSTAHRRLNDPGFQDRLRAIRGDLVQRTAGILAAASTMAVKTLLSLQKESVAPNVRLGAARAILEIGSKMREAVEMEERFAVLERRAFGEKDA
jgi:hypothetical protein